MEIILLGSGTSIPLSNRGSPSFILLLNGHTILFDMGPGTIRQLAKTGMNFAKIGQIFITHFHPDHTADLIHFLFATRHPPILKKREPFTITGPDGLKNLIKKLQEAYGTWLNIPPEILTIEELTAEKPEKKGYDNFNILTQPTNHTPHSIAYRIEDRSGKSLVYSGDTGFCDGIIDLAQGSDLLILECSFPDNKRQEGHLTPSLAGKIASLAGVKKLLLTHFYPEVLKTDVTEQCRKTYAGELILGKDLLHVNIK